VTWAKIVAYVPLAVFSAGKRGRLLGMLAHETGRVAAGLPSAMRPDRGRRVTGC
jgi:hypothetical protein